MRRIGAEVPGGHGPGPGRPAAPGQELALGKGRVEANPQSFPQEGSGGRVRYYQLDEIWCYSVVFRKEKGGR